MLVDLQLPLAIVLDEQRAWRYRKRFEDRKRRTPTDVHNAGPGVGLLQLAQRWSRLAIVVYKRYQSLNVPRVSQKNADRRRVSPGGARRYWVIMKVKLVGLNAL